MVAYHANLVFWIMLRGIGPNMRCMIAKCSRLSCVCVTINHTYNYCMCSVRHHQPHNNMLRSLIIYQLSVMQ